MNYIRLLTEGTLPEYFEGEEEILFLGDIKNINIIIGANNSRKSRFARHIIKQEHKVIFSFGGDLNGLYRESTQLFNRKNNEPEELWTLQWLAISLDNLDEKYPLHKIIKSFFHRKAGLNALDIVSVRNAVIELAEQLKHIATVEAFETFKVHAGELWSVLNMAVAIYEYIGRNGGRHMDGSRLGEQIKSISYGFEKVNPGDHVPYWKERLELLQKALSLADKFQQITLGPLFPNIIYIPVLRTARKLDGVNVDIFQETLRKQYKISEDSKLSIETGLSLYEKVNLARNGSRNDIRNFHAFEKFIGDTFFQGKEVHIIARRTGNSQSEHIHISLPDELEDISIHDLGDGIQGIISLLFPVFTAPNSSWVIIDEPENHLHPGYQLIFIQALAGNDFLRKKDLKYFITTHSNHILSESLLTTTGLEVFVFKRRDERSSYITSINGNERNTLEMLGVLNTSVLISNCTVWIEGITDRLYLKAFLFAFLNSKPDDFYRPKEGLNYAFIEYGGKNLSHYNFDEGYSNDEDGIIEKINAFFINSNVYVLADNDLNDEKHKAFDSIKRPNFKYRHTSLPEIENLLPKSIWERFFIESLQCDSESILEALDFDHTMKLGKHFQNKIKKNGRDLKIEKLQGNGTLEYRYKKGISDFVYRMAMAKELTWADFAESEILKEIIEELYDFISIRNLK
ncbi:ATP-dependent nuclease [Mucilaginibacter aquaedulcis]|uniref:ATP-dependent nuclease n=1 Tax=Mucilaginibacter aquaedulcis TaxID=1187081 RepID=UPI0025B5C72B|nr:AAA family ATPase [Mucilaginibacter aquaedulcis]MDN3551005.1 AAA family ATPase [Mucilaginibacter aquaedulcis]